MQSITFNDTNVSTYIFTDETALVATPTEITCPRFIIGDMNSTNATIHTGVTPPEDWCNSKYMFDGTTWTLDATWRDPQDLRIADLERQIAELKS